MNLKRILAATICRPWAMYMPNTVEGVVRAEQADLLQQLGCHEGQGVLFAHALPFADILHLFRPGQAPILPG